MQNKRNKRSKIRAARRTAGHGSKKKHRGSGHRGGFGKSNIGKRGSAKIQKITGKGGNTDLGKHGFKSLEVKPNSINLQELQARLQTYLNQGIISKNGNTYTIDLETLGYSKLLSKGLVTEKMDIKVESATETAVEKVVAAGGKVETTKAPEDTEEVK